MTPTDHARVKNLGLTLAEFARRAGVAYGTVSRWGKTSAGGIPHTPLWVWELLTAWERLRAVDRAGDT